MKQMLKGIFYPGKKSHEELTKLVHYMQNKIWNLESTINNLESKVTVLLATVVRNEYKFIEKRFSVCHDLTREDEHKRKQEDELKKEGYQFSQRLQNGDEIWIKEKK